MTAPRILLYNNGEHEPLRNAPLFVHPRIARRHPELLEDDVRQAWMSCIASKAREPENGEVFLAVGFDRNGRLIELVARRSSRGEWLIYHAMTPPSKRTLIELGLLRRGTT